MDPRPHDRPRRDTAPLPVRWLVGLAILAAVVRLLAFAFNYPFAPPREDASVYDELALNLLNAGQFSISQQPPYEPMALRTPGYPAFVAAVYAVAGHSPDAVRLVQIAIASLTTVPLMLLAWRLTTPSAALIAGIVYALYPPLVAYTLHVLSDGNQAVLVVLTLYCAHRAIDSGRYLHWAATGLALGLATLNRPDVQLVALPLFGAMALLSRVRSGLLWRALAVTAAMAVLLTPWLVRNALTFDRFIGLSTGVGYAAIVSKLELEGHLEANLHRKLNELYGAEFERQYGRPMTFIDGALPAEDAKRRQDVVEFVKTQPVTFAIHSLRRFGLLWQPKSFAVELGVHGDFRELFTAGRYGVLAFKLTLLAIDAAAIALLAVGVIIAVGDWRRWAPLLIMLAYLTASYSLVHAYSRYRLPMMAFAPIFIGAAATAIWTRWVQPLMSGQNLSSRVG